MGGDKGATSYQGRHAACRHCVGCRNGDSGANRRVGGSEYDVLVLRWRRARSPLSYGKSDAYTSTELVGGDVLFLFWGLVVWLVGWLVVWVGCFVSGFLFSFLFLFFFSL